METYYDEMSTTDTESTETTAVATDETTIVTESSVPEKEIAHRIIWARAHKGIIYEVTDPDLRSQLAYYRKRDKQLMQTAVQEEVAI